VTDKGPAATPVMLACAIPDLVGSATLVAETETVFGEGAKPGALKSPTLSIVPVPGEPPSTPLTFQDTLELNVPVPLTTAANCWAPPADTDTEVGDTETELIVGDVEGTVCEVVPPPQAIKDEIETTTTNSKANRQRFVRGHFG
jgi:hypothetical protein